MEDKEVKDKTVPDKAPEKQKDLKKPSGKSATGKPLDGIDINPQLNDVSTDGNQLKIRKEDSVDLTAPVIQERKALTLPQRQQRARSLRANERKLERAREVAKTKLAPSSKIQQRAMSHARAIVKKRFAARKGTPYAELTTSEKIQVDTAVSKKTKLIQKIAARLLPRIRKAEYERLKSFRNGEQLKDLSTQNPKAQGIMPKVSEEMAQLFNTLDSADTNSLIGIIENTINQFKQNNDPLGDQLKRMLDAVLPKDVVTESLLKKSNKTGIAFSTLKEVFDRGEYSWDASKRMSQEQYAFARVNSYIAKGKAWHMDADIREVKVVNAKLDESFAVFLEASVGTKARKKIEVVDRPPANQTTKTRQTEIQKKIIDETRSPGKAYVKPYIHPQTKEQIGYVASTKWGKIKHFGKEFKSHALKHAGISESVATPLNESFNMAWTSGIGVTLSAADCGIQIKGGFALHPDVIDQMQIDEFDEEVRSADIEGVVVHTADGKTIVRKQKRNRKIIGTGNLTDGKPDDTI
jgi:hypothetical protein